MDTERHLPLNPRVLALLVALLEGPTHGYALKTAVEEGSDHTVTMDPGSLYRHLSRLEEDGLVAEVPTPHGEAHGDPRRRFYGLTPLGRAVLAAETRRLRSLLPGAKRLHGLERG